MLKAVFWMILLAALLSWWTPLAELFLVVLGAVFLFRAATSRVHFTA